MQYKYIIVLENGKIWNNQCKKCISKQFERKLNVWNNEVY